MRQAGLLDAGRIHDRSGELLLSDRVATFDQEVASIQYAHVAYVDNFVVVGVDEFEVNDVTLRIAEVLRTWGFIAHDLQAACLGTVGAENRRKARKHLYVRAPSLQIEVCDG